MKTGLILWVEGIIGAGKTTLARQLGSELNMRVMEEPVGTNKYLELFYQDPKRWAFPMQIHLLIERYGAHKLAAYEAGVGTDYAGVILDRGLPGDRVFAKLHMQEGNISELEWETYEKAFDTFTCSLTPPGLVMFLDVEPDVALYRTEKRNRAAEFKMSDDFLQENSGMLEYLKKLREGYEDMLQEIESGNHAWSRRMEVKRVEWNGDYTSIGGIVQYLIQEYDLR